MADMADTQEQRIATLHPGDWSGGQALAAWTFGGGFFWGSNIWGEETPVPKSEVVVIQTFFCLGGGLVPIGELWEEFEPRDWTPV